MPDMLQRCPVLVVGCKKDLVDQNKSKQMQINSKVLDMLKEIDGSRQIDYIEAGLSQHRGVYKVLQDELLGYIGKLFNDSIPIVEDEYEEGIQSVSSMSESSDSESVRK